MIREDQGKSKHEGMEDQVRYLAICDPISCDTPCSVMPLRQPNKARYPLPYRVTGNFYITVMIFPGINFGITLHSPYRIYFWAEIFLLYMTLPWPQPLSFTSFCFQYITSTLREANRFCDALHYGYIKNGFRNFKCNNFRPTGTEPLCCDSRTEKVVPVHRVSFWKGVWKETS